MDNQDETLWHKFNPFLPRKTIDGPWTQLAGQVWRRKQSGKWEYRQDEMTYEEWLDSQW